MQSVRDFARREPLIVRGLIAALVLVAAQLGFDVDPNVVYTALAAVGIVVGTGRRKVTPAAK